MDVGSLPLVQAQAQHRLLEQYLLACPGCGKSSIAHVGRAPDGAPFLVRFVCPEACAVDDAGVLAAVTTDAAPMSA